MVNFFSHWISMKRNEEKRNQRKIRQRYSYRHAISYLLSWREYFLIFMSNSQNKWRAQRRPDSELFRYLIFWLFSKLRLRRKRIIYKANSKSIFSGKNDLDRLISVTDRLNREGIEIQAVCYFRIVYKMKHLFQRQKKKGKSTNFGTTSW